MLLLPRFLKPEVFGGFLRGTAPQDGSVVQPRNRMESPLHLAAAEGDCNAVRDLLKQGVPVNLATVLGETPLHEAAAAGEAECVRYLLEQGASMEMSSRDGDRALHLAARSPEALQPLLSAGAFVDGTNRFGDSPLHAAAWGGNVQSLELLLAHGASALDVRGGEAGGETPLDVARMRGHAQAIELLQGTGSGDSTREEDEKPQREAAARLASMLHSPRRPPPESLDARWQQRALAMAPVSAGLLVHADSPADAPKSTAHALLLEGETCDTLSKFRLACQGLALEEQRAVLRVPGAIDAASCAALREVLDEEGIVVVNSVDGLPTRAVGLDAEDLADVLGAEAFGALRRLPAQFLRATQPSLDDGLDGGLDDGLNDGLDGGLDDGLELVGAFVRRYSADTANDDQPWISFHFDK